MHRWRSLSRLHLIFSHAVTKSREPQAILKSGPFLREQKCLSTHPHFLMSSRSSSSALSAFNDSRRQPFTLRSSHKQVQISSKVLAFQKCWLATTVRKTKDVISENEKEGTVAVDRSQLFNPTEHSHTPVGGKSEETPLIKHLKTIIRFRSGPIPVAEYMEEVLTNPVEGFYMNRDVFGQGGDFITSPDISQMFGEMVGVWTMTLWQLMGSPSRFRLVELGPGRGTLMADLLRGTSTFKQFAEAVEVHLVEVSPALRKLQYKNLRCRPSHASNPDSGVEAFQSPEPPLEVHEKKSIHGSREAPELLNGGISDISGALVSWHLDLESVPRGVPTIILAHEFFDALPVHQFQMTEHGWREKLIDVADDDSPHHFRFVLAPKPTPASNLFLRKRLKWAGRLEKNTQVEVCPGGLKIAADIAKRVGEDGGGALIIDYGENRLVQDSLQAIRSHKFVNVLDGPGTADLSAYVDFPALSHSVQDAKSGATAYGPVAQNKFLFEMGINFRVEALMANATPEQQLDLKMGYWRLMGEGEPTWVEEGGEEENVKAPQGMGSRYQALAITSDSLGAPAGFL